MGDLDEEFRVACEREQEIELLRLVERAVGHVVDDHGQFWILFDEGHEIGQAVTGVRMVMGTLS